ncbi:YNG2 [Candida pseudojiufengensis]|uniref:YNG2 n=1 Tax=Candida pseudojiufengensis TaxID=497109 RepID=UPI0022242190|nr:YNG2 [Candida pseudojiufengensis]KAI5964768.1 YNG2 [Candida pseudojiufengensis]
MDTSTVLEKYTQDLSNLPLEVRHLLEEIKNKDIQVVDLRRQCQLKDTQIHKFVRANGTLTKHPKEQQLYSKIEEDMKKMKKLQKEKILLSNTALFLVSKHLFNFETDISKLERDELLPPLEAPIDLDNLVKDDLISSLNGLSDSLSATPTPRNPLSMTPIETITNSSSSAVKKGQKRKQTTKGMSSSGSTPGSTIALPSSSSSSSNKQKKLKSEEIEDVPAYETGSLAMDAGGSMDIQQGEDADNNLYCFCQRVSFGEMIGCDNDDCKYEWFHWSCVGITSPPRDDEIWYCPDCRTKKKKRRN